MGCSRLDLERCCQMHVMLHLSDHLYHQDASLFEILLKRILVGEGSQKLLYHVHGLQKRILLKDLSNDPVLLSILIRVFGNFLLQVTS